METSLLRTKLYIPPPRPELVPRPRLIERLDAALVLDDKYRGLHRKLTLVSAPAGFGKTTLVSEWANQRISESGIGRPVAWVSLDENDNDPARFLVYVIAALQTLEAEIGKGALSALQSPQPPPAEAILTVLINELAVISDRILLVLDDYHLIEAEPVHDALAFLLEYLPHQMHLVIATRDDPPLPLARLRARGQLTELRATDLCFSSSEAAEFLNRVMGLGLSAEDVAALEARTEGWIAGLQLAAISMQGREDATDFIQSFAGSHRFVLDYLVEEVLEQQSESVQTFLLHTSILDRLTGSLCDAVRFGKAKSPSSSFGTARAEQEDGQATLEMLERANLFIVPLDEERRWYRYHHLFADLLRQRLRQNPPPLSSPPTGGKEGGAEGRIVAELHRRASEWYEQNGFTDEAIEHALLAQDSERVACLIEAHADGIWRGGQHVRLRRWLAGLPVEVRLSRPDLCILHAWNLFTSGQQDAAEQSLLAAEKAIDICDDRASQTLPAKGDQPSGPVRNRIRGRAATIRAFLASYWGDVPGAIQFARQALETLPEQDLSWRSTASVALSDAYSFSGQMAEARRVRRGALEASKAAGNVYMALITSMKLAVTLRSQGHLQQAVEMCQQHVELAERSGWSQAPVVGCLLAVWGEVLTELDDLNGALERAKTGVDLTERGSDVAMIGWSNVCLMMVLFSRGDMAGAGRIIQEMQGMAREQDLPTFVANPMAAWQARIWLAQDRLDAASQWLGEHRLEAGGELAFLHDIEYVELTEYVGLARILIAQGRLGEATTLLQRLLDRSEALGHTSRVIQILILQALAFEAGGDTSQAMTALEQALAVAEPAGFVRIFVNEGPPMARLLREAAARGIMPGYVGKLLAAFGDGTKDDRRTRTDRELSASSVVHRPSSALVEPLSERELEVLRLIAEGLTNREIAARLYLALNTVKAHTRNIYGKLGVHSRTQAVTRSQELGLLPRK